MRKIILTFQHYQTLPQLIFLSGYRDSKCQAKKKRVVSAVPTGKTCYDFYATQKINTHESHKWFAGHYSQVAGTAGNSLFA